ncbi:flagellar basal body-associated FliL family protein [Demequina iriomotensis]|uniref:flagellar basal body-associated FliL family protein n=1 Tax=Demequina iriomotensis TaxID=1536641 RepID=UPI00078533FE|nr:flagellar basal body-associated FliL family protein [Demequina iriomotensis]
MSNETRVMAPRPTIGTRPSPLSAPPAAAPEPEPEQPKGRKRLPALIIGVLVLVIAAGAYWFLAGPGASTGAEDPAAEVAEEPVELGDVQTVDAISLNLQGGHYLRIGLGLQLGAEGHGEVDPALALDATIALFSGHQMDELMNEEVREELKAELAAELEELYHGEVLGVYYTDFVTQ